MHIPLPFVLLLVFIASAFITSSCHGLTIVSVTPQTALTGLPFEAKLVVAYDALDHLNPDTTVRWNLGNVTGQARVFDVDTNLLTSSFIMNGLIQPIGGSSTWNLNVTLLSMSAPPGMVVTTTFPVWCISGTLTIVPLLVCVGLALLTGNVFVALFMGIWTACFIQFQMDLVLATMRSLDTRIVGAMANEDHVKIILFCMFTSGLVAMIRKSGGADGMAQRIARLAKTSQSAQFATLLAGVAIFFDDYASALILGNTFLPIFDQLCISRAKLAFIVDSGAAPISALIPLTSWTAFEMSLLQQEADKIRAGFTEPNMTLKSFGYEDSGFLALMRSLEYRFYSVFLLFLQIVLIYQAREYGSMLTFERRALLGLAKEDSAAVGTTVSPPSSEAADAAAFADPHPSTPRRCKNAVIPIVVLVVLILAGMIGIGLGAIPPEYPITVAGVFAESNSIDALLYASAITSVITGLFYRMQVMDDNVPEVVNGPIVHATRRWWHHPLMSLSDSLLIWLKGLEHMVTTICILVLAWAIGNSIESIGAGRFFVRVFESTIPPSALPGLVFLISSIVAFATGTSWGTMSAMFPLLSPVAFQLSRAVQDPNLYYASLGAILEGSVFGDHASVISDTTVLCSMACGIDLTLHVKTQLPYALTTALFALVLGYFMVGSGANPAISYMLCLVILPLWVRVVGAAVESEKLDLLTAIQVWWHRKILGRDVSELEAIKVRDSLYHNGLRMETLQQQDVGGGGGGGSDHDQKELQQHRRRLERDDVDAVNQDVVMRKSNDGGGGDGGDGEIDLI